jgi:CubicO group peptidase (beta-lactamase class C family)
VQGRAVTVRQLLSHTAGIKDYAEVPALRALSDVDLPSDSLLAFVRTEPFYFAPGDQMRYSNTGFALAGQLVERVTGVPYARWVEEQVLRPAGLAHTRFCDRPELAPRATGYAMTPEGIRRARSISPYLPWAAGGFCGTAGDLARWNAALHGGQVLGAAAYAEMIRPATIRGGRVARYGLGTSLHAMAGRRAIGHGGDIDGFTTYAARFPDDSLTVVALINTQGPARPDAMVAAAAEAVLGPAVRAATTGSAPDLDALAGRYGGDVAISVVTTPAGERALQVVRGPMRPFLLRY